MSLCPLQSHQPVPWIRGHLAVRAEQKSAEFGSEQGPSWQTHASLDGCAPAKGGHVCLRTGTRGASPHSALSPRTLAKPMTPEGPALTPR